MYNMLASVVSYRIVYVKYMLYITVYGDIYCLYISRQGLCVLTQHGPPAEKIRSLELTSATSSPPQADICMLMDPQPDSNKTYYKVRVQWKKPGLGIRSFAHRSFDHSLISLKSNERL